jgi:hypothetical protein
MVTGRGSKEVSGLRKTGKLREVKWNEENRKTKGGKVE